MFPSAPRHPSLQGLVCQLSGLAERQALAAQQLQQLQQRLVERVGTHGNPREIMVKKKVLKYTKIPIFSNPSFKILTPNQK